MKVAFDGPVNLPLFGKKFLAYGFKKPSYRLKFNLKLIIALKYFRQELIDQLIED